MAQREAELRYRLDHIYCFVPSDGIDIVVLAAYLKKFIHGTATIRPSRHPTDIQRVGYTVGASTAIPQEGIEDLISDTNCWVREQLSSEFEESPYDYYDSDTWQTRKKRGQTLCTRPSSKLLRSAKGGRNRDNSASRASSPKDWLSHHRQDVDEKPTMYFVTPPDGGMFEEADLFEQMCSGEDPADRRPYTRLKLPWSGLFASAMALNAVGAACYPDAIRHDALQGLHLATEASTSTSEIFHHLISHVQHLPPEVCLIGYATFGVLLVYMAKSTPDHKHKDSIFFGSVAFGVMAIITDVYLGTRFQISICRVMLVVLFCGQVVSLVMGKVAGKKTSVEGMGEEAMLEEKK